MPPAPTDRGASPPAANANPPSPPMVALVAWLVPGGGYLMIGQRARGLVIGGTIIALFFGGILIGGVRAIQVPGYGENGGRLYVRTESGKRVMSELPADQDVPPNAFWVVTDFKSILAEIGNKPWSICQVMAGPTALIGGGWSVWASRGDPAPGVLSHSRINEIAVLYTAVAGMLNLLAIIDSAGRADDVLAATSGQRSKLFSALHWVIRRLHLG